VLSEEDLEEPMKALEEQLLTKNVASEIATHLCRSVTTSLVGQKLERFQSISTKVKAALKVRCCVPSP
jgi:signal recognition particle receptor subunit alpha